MEWLKIKLKWVVGIPIASVMVLGSPIIPVDTYWTAFERVAENGTRECFNEFYKPDGKSIIEEISCDTYWDIVRTPYAKIPMKRGFVSLLAPKKVDAAIAFVATSNSGIKQDVSSFTFTHTNAGGTDDFLYVGIGIVDNTDVATSTVTYNTDSMTVLRADVNTSSLTQKPQTEIFYLANPDDGTTLVVSVTLAAIVDNVVGGAAVFTGVDQVNPIEVYTGNKTTDSTTVSTTLTTISDNAWTIDMAVDNDFTGPNTFNTGQTTLWNVDHSDQFMASYEGPITPAGSTSMGEGAGDVGSDWAHTMAALKPAVAAGGGAEDAKKGHRQGIIWVE